MKIRFKNEIKVVILTSSLPESCYTVVAALNSSRRSDKLKFDEIQDVSESIPKWKIGDSSGNTLSVDQRKRSKSKSRNKHGRSK